MIYFCFIEGDDQHDVEMKLLEAVEDGPALQEARALRFGGRTGYVFDGDRSVGSVETSREPVSEEPFFGRIDREPSGAVLFPDAGACPFSTISVYAQISPVPCRR
ncbi:hypothetical protein D3C87_1317540 [compost metagenome]